jgi:hypothetical protein
LANKKQLTITLTTKRFNSEEKKNDDQNKKLLQQSTLNCERSHSGMVSNKNSTPFKREDQKTKKEANATTAT